MNGPTRRSARRSMMQQANPHVDGMSAVLAANIDRMNARRARDRLAMPRSHRLADRITAFAGSMTFVALHLVFYAAWVAVSLGVMPGVPQMDAEFTRLATEASIEAIFLSTFVLISQNRMMTAAAEEAALDLQINLLTEHELTRLAGLIESIAVKLDVPVHASELAEIKQDISVNAVLDALAAQRGARG